jgi:hypothetical protein
MCSTERKPSRAARPTSLTVTSFCRSSQALPFPATCQTAAPRASASSARGTSTAGAATPSSRRTATAAPAPPASAPCVENTPAAAPAARIPGTAASAGTNAAIASRQTGRPPR